MRRAYVNTARISTLSAILVPPDSPQDPQALQLRVATAGVTFATRVARICASARGDTFAS